LSHIDKKHRAEEFEKLKMEPGSPGVYNAIRLPNKVSSQIKSLGESQVSLKQQEIMSPTAILGGAGRLENFFNNDDKASV
jgi:hypothetical protein